MEETWKLRQSIHKNYCQGFIISEYGLVLDETIPYIGTVIDNITFHQELWESMKSSFQRLNRGFYLSSIFQSKGVA